MLNRTEPYRLKYTRNSLHQKAYKGNTNAIRRWLAGGGDADIRDLNGQTLLHAAVHGDNVELVELLVAHGADVNACSNEYPYYTYPIQTAAYNGSDEIFQVLIANGADASVESSNGCTLIHLAVFNDSVSTVRYLLARGADIEIPAESGVTPLCSATMHSLKEVSEILLRAGANPNAEYADGLTPLAQCDDPEIAQMLIEFGADVNYIGHNGRSPLFYVGSLEALEVMLSHGARLDIVDEEGNTLLHQAAAEMIILDIDAQTDELVYRAMPEGMKIAELFIERGLDISRRNNDGLTPLAVAIAEQNDDMANFLRSHGGV